MTEAKVAVGVETLTKAAVAVGEIGTKLGAILHDGINLRDLPDAIGLIDPVEAILSLSGSAAMGEIIDADSVEQKAVTDAFKAKFDLPDDAIEGAVEGGVELALRWAALIKETAEFSKKLLPVVTSIPS